MPESVLLTLTEKATAGLFCVQRYRFLTIDQFARASGLHYITAANKLRFFQQHGLLGHFGNTGVRGNGKTPKAYFLTRKGFEFLAAESAIPAELRIVPETSDYVDAEESSENKIIPDAAYILENRETKRRALFFLEMDMGTERITTAFVGNKQSVLHHKFSQYDRYLKSMRFTQTYKEYGEFRSFTMLFVTQQAARIENTRRELLDLPQELSGYYRLTTFDEAMGDFLGSIWKSRLATDVARYALVRE
jgi:Replication-relaxation